ncbi:AAA ATPase-like protein [Asanoa ferruginea]|uniref:AAA ATPase-like protein n=1 Tax=Asanoa ferruginea TaxID=53367 RepID=A0A3D9ZVU6_9ACTN|nr:BTAD domain-containing putative transcriptional regulator [Asanoa ferruginea]REG01346.1 AAA ATPase-like protein [Asanoa ferruginea]
MWPACGAPLEPDRDPGGESKVLRGLPGGYELCVDPDALDAARFEALADSGARALADGDPRTAEQAFLSALGLWRGDSVAAGDLAALRTEAARLVEARRMAEEGWHAAAIAAGRHAAVLPALRRFVADHPERESARARLMLALYRSGQQTAALAVFDEGRRHLAEDYGVEPGQALRDLQRQILEHAVPSPPDAQPVVTSSLVGRATELATLTDLLTSALDGSGRIVALVGEAGIGKTSLATAVSDQARAMGVPVVWGRCPDLGQAPPFWLWSQVVRALAALPQAGESGAAAALNGFTPGPTATADHDPAARFHAYEAVAALVGAVARQDGLVIVLDDLHAADRDSLLLLRFLATALPASRVLVVATLRPYGQLPDTVAALADLARVGVRQLHPAGLDTAAVTDLVRARTGVRPPDADVARLLARTGGNPFFLTELLASPGGSAPPSIRDVVRSRFAALSPAGRGCLDLLCVAGRELDLRLLAAATGQPVTEVAELLAEPAIAHLVAEAGPGAIRMRHPLFAEVGHAELPPSRRALLHARLADAAADGTVLAPAELAHHYGQALGLGREADHLRWTLRAAEDATRRVAYEDALAHLERAAALLAAGSPATARAELAVQLHRTALLQITVGVGSDAVDEVCVRARELLTLAGPDADSRAALWTLGELAANRAEFQIAEDLGGRLSRAAGAGDPLLASAGSYLLGAVSYFTGRLAAAEEHLSRSIERLREVEVRALAEQVGRTPPLSPLNFRALVRSLRGDAAAARADLAEAADLAERTDDPYARGNVAMFTGWLAMQQGDAESGRAAAERCRAVDVPHFTTIAEFLTEWVAVRGGDLDRCDAMRRRRPSTLSGCGRPARSPRRRWPTRAWSPATARRRRCWPTRASRPRSTSGSWPPNSCASAAWPARTPTTCAWAPHSPRHRVLS